VHITIEYTILGTLEICQTRMTERTCNLPLRN
jgi:hypothetical protein